MERLNALQTSSEVIHHIDARRIDRPPPRAEADAHRVGLVAVLRDLPGVIGGDAFEKAVDERPQLVAGSRLDEHVIHKIRFKFDTIRRP